MNVVHRIRPTRFPFISTSRRANARSLSSSGISPPSTWSSFEDVYGSKILSLPEYKAVEDLGSFLNHRKDGNSITDRSSETKSIIPTMEDSYKHELSAEDFMIALDASMATFLLHVNARIASMVGKGYYTIGPCGEELFSAAAFAIQPQDSTALHYRHTAFSIARQINESMSSCEDGTFDSSGGVNKNQIDNNIIDQLLLARARGYCVSRYDPVTGGVHCSIGGGPNEFLVTSTLSSQCPPAVGRALGYALRDDIMKISHERPTGGGGGDIRDNMTPSHNEKAVSFVTIGDGSLHNHHFLSSLTLARHAKHLNIKCPVVFGISDNGLSISYETKQYVDSVFPDSSISTTNGSISTDPLMPVFRVNGQDIMSIYDQTKQAVDYSRKYQSPCVILYRNLVRRFGHAATDRQDAYLDMETIQVAADTCVLKVAIAQGVEVFNYTTYGEIKDRFDDLRIRTDEAFGIAINEPKVTLDDMMDRVTVPLVPVPSFSAKTQGSDKDTTNKPNVMRKQMTRVIGEALDSDESVVYLGEDVRHGGYYLVTEGLAKKHPKRVLDFPPDETTLLGAALGFSQLGLTPIVEIPYAKYLDCGADMFYEIAIMNWLRPPASTLDDVKSKQRNSGMIIRLQGFDRGLFGGNFHTHNSLSHIPPGVDVVCYSNGEDYVRGFRHALFQAKNGRVVMLVDCTNLLNLRHVHDKDRSWEVSYPIDPDEMIGFDYVFRYTVDENNKIVKQDVDSATPASIAIISYGNSVVTSLQARRGLVERGIVISEDQIDVIDCPYISNVPSGLRQVLNQYNHVVFADICKEGPGSNAFSNMISVLNGDGSLPQRWSFVGAPRTYNPLGSTVTFLNQDTIEDAVIKLLRRS